MSLCLALLLPAVSFADDVTYRQEVMAKINAFGNRNRVNIESLNRDIHANCYIPVTVSIVIRRDGTVDHVLVVKSSTVPVVDNWYRWIIQQAAPYPPLATHYDPVPDEITITQEFRLDTSLYSDDIESTRPCEPVRPRSQQSDEKRE